MTNTCFNIECPDWSQNSLVVSEELDSDPAPEMEEDIDGDGDWQQQTVETQTVGKCYRK